VAESEEEYLSTQELTARIEQTKKEMKQAAAALEFEQAAALRDRLHTLEQRALGVKLGTTVAVPLPSQKKTATPTKGRAGRGASGRTSDKAAARGRAARWQK
jgi:excinuclease ABC subunit B